MRLRPDMVKEEKRFPLPFTIPHADAIGIRNIALRESLVEGQEGIRFFDEPTPTPEELSEMERIYLASVSPEVQGAMERVRQKIANLGHPLTILERYQLEYDEGLYDSIKPGLTLQSDFLDIQVQNFGSFFEIGGGNGPFCKAVLDKDPNKRVIVADIVKSPKVEMDGMEYTPCDILDDVDTAKLIAMGKEQDLPPFYVMSYFLDRVPDQMKALDNFAKMIHETGGEGLITVCLPPNESDFAHFDRSKWITTSGSATQDFDAIVKYCKDLGLIVGNMGITSHMGRSLDKFEGISTYCLRLSSKK